MADPTSDLSFPQQATTHIPTPNPTTEATQRQAGPNFFRDGENVQFMRTEKLADLDFKEADQTVHLRVATHQWVNRTAQTHDSVMHQFVDVPDASGELFFEISFFTDAIFRVRFAGERAHLEEEAGTFPPSEAQMLIGKRHPSVGVKLEKDEESVAILSSQSVRIEIEKEPFRLRAYKKDFSVPFWQQRLSDLFVSDIVPTSIARHDGRTATFESFSLQPNENLYGLGERFDSVSRVGRLVDFVNHDAIGTSNTRTYINVPFFWSTAGYGCFVNHNARTEWDLGRSEQGTAGFCTEENYMDYFVIHGDSPQEILQRYTSDLTGTAPKLPPWTFGMWLSRNSYESWEVVDNVLKKAKEERIPVDDIHLDTMWFKEDWNPDLIFDDDRFRDHKAKMASLKEDGIHISLWQYTFAPPREDNSLFVEAKKREFLGMNKNADGSRGSELFSYPEGSSGWKIDDAVIDYSNPDARAWYAAKITGLIRDGASAIKTDFGDCIPPDAWYMNIEGRRFQNLFSLVYNATIWSAMKSANSDAVVWARSGTAGSQRYPVHWGGDSQCSWSALQGTVKATLAIGLSGFAYFSHDIGGFIGKPTPELYVRWAQMGLLGASHSRSHGAGNENSREPWAFGDAALAAFRKAADLRYQLLPYLIQQGRSGAERGLPLIRHLILDWPHDRNVWHIENQYLLGDSILVAPMLRPLDEVGPTIEVYFPAGTWYLFQSHDNVWVSRGEWKEVPTPALENIAMWVREGSMLCYAAAGRQRTWNSPGAIVKIELYGAQPRISTRPGRWQCGNGEDGDVVVEADAEGRLACTSHRDAQVVLHRAD